MIDDLIAHLGFDPKTTDYTTCWIWPGPFRHQRRQQRPLFRDRNPVPLLVEYVNDQKFPINPYNGKLLHNVTPCAVNPELCCNPFHSRVKVLRDPYELIRNDPETYSFGGINQDGRRKPLEFLWGDELEALRISILGDEKWTDEMMALFAPVNAHTQHHTVQGQGLSLHLPGLVYANDSHSCWNWNGLWIAGVAYHDGRPLVPQLCKLLGLESTKESCSWDPHGCVNPHHALGLIDPPRSREEDYARRRQITPPPIVEMF